MSDFWEGIKEMFWLLWGESWTGIESVGRYAFLALVAIVLGMVVAMVAAGHSDRRFVRSCYARGGHVHYSYRSVPGPVIVIGSVGVPTTGTATTMTFAKGKEEDCQRCSDV
jgi:hypothetical protein